MNDYSEFPELEPGDPWLYQMQMLEYEEFHHQYDGDESILKKQFSTIIVGTTYHDTIAYASLRSGDYVSLVREPENEHDNNAVAVFAQNRKKVGFIPRNDALTVSNFFSVNGYTELQAVFLRGRIYIEGIGVRDAMADICDCPEHGSIAPLTNFDLLGEFEIVQTKLDDRLGTSEAENPPGKPYA